MPDTLKYKDTDIELERLWKEYEGICANNAAMIESAVMSRLVTDLTFEG